MREITIVDDSAQDSRQASPGFLLGIDWGGKEHAVCLLDRAGKKLDERKIRHSATGIAEGLTWLRKHVGPDLVVVAAAMEAPRDAFLEALLDAGAAVFSTNPKQSDRFRDRHTVAGAKDDRRDAFVLADALRTDPHCFRRVESQEPGLVAMRELTRQQTSLDRNLLRCTNRLRERLQRIWPELLELAPGANEPWLWALLDRAPSPVQGRRLTVATLTRLLRRHRIRRFSVAELRAVLSVPLLPVAPGVREAAASAIAIELPVIKALVAQQKVCGREIEALLQTMAQPLAESQEQCEHRDVTILRSLPGAGRVVVATMLAEAPEALSRRDYRALRAHAGIAPFTHQSGKRASVVMRRACNARLREVFYHFARANVQLDDRSKRLYQDARARGHSHGRALRTVADHLLRILIAMLLANTLFTPPETPVSTGDKSLDER